MLRPGIGAREDAMIAILVVGLAVSSSILIVAFAWSRLRGIPIAESMPSGLQRTLRMAGGPFSISIAIHLAVILTLIVVVHESRARDHVIEVWVPGSLHSLEQFEPMEFPDVETAPIKPAFDDLPKSVNIDKVIGANSNEISATPVDNGIILNRSLGGYLNLHPGPGSGGGEISFPWYISDLRHKGLDVVLVIDGTKSMEFVMADVKARMAQLAVRVRQLVPIARVGVVVFGGKGEPLDIQPLTLSTAKLKTFLGSIQAKGGGEWEENTLGALQAAVTKMDWKPYARKVIVLIGDSPPEKDDFAPIVALIRDFRRNNGTLSGIDVQEEEHERFERAFWIKVHGQPPKTISPLPQFARQAQAAYKMMAAQGRGSIRSLSHDADVNHQVMILIFGDKWQDEISRYASR